MRSIRHHRVIVFCVAALALTLAGCGNRAEEVAQEERPVVVAVNYPLAYFANRIGAEFVDVQYPAPANADPEFWQPTNSQIETYQNADLILLNGAGYAQWVQKASLPEANEVDTSRGFSGSLIEIEDAVTHSHGPEGEHTHAGTASITWLDFDQAAQQANAVMEGLSVVKPDEAASMRANFGRLQTDLEAMDVRMGTAVAALRRQHLYASHPVYQYFARRYGLDVENFHLDPDQMPSEPEWTTIEQALAKNPSRIMLWEHQPIEDISTRLSKLGVVSVVVDPCANTPSNGDFLTVMEQNLTNLLAVTH